MEDRRGALPCLQLQERPHLNSSKVHVRIPTMPCECVQQSRAAAGPGAECVRVTDLLSQSKEGGGRQREVVTADEVGKEWRGRWKEWKCGRDKVREMCNRRRAEVRRRRTVLWWRWVENLLKIYVGCKMFNSMLQKKKNTIKWRHVLYKKCMLLNYSSVNTWSNLCCI